MKQTKKLTRNQRTFLLKHHIDIEGVRVVSETNEAIVYITKDGEQKVFNKGGEKGYFNFKINI